MATMPDSDPTDVDYQDEVIVITFEGTEQCRALLRWAEAHQIDATDGNECGDPACCGFITMRCRVPRHLIATLPSGWDWED